LLSEKKFKVGVIGVGSIAQIAHLPILKERYDVELVGVMAKHHENALHAQQQYGFKTAAEDFHEFLDLDLDCAFVLSPKAEHPGQVDALIKSGIDVFCEKPLAMTLAEAEHIANESEAQGVTVMVGFNRRFAPVYRKAKLAFGTAMPDVAIAQKNRPKSEYRATLENAIHMVDLLRYFNGECDTVHAISRFSDPYYETMTTAQLSFKNGSVGILVADRASGQWEETMEIHGGGLTVLVDSPDSITVTDGDQSHTTKMTPIAMGWARVVDKLGFSQAVDHFFECLKTHEQPLTNAKDAFETHLLMHRILKSAGLPALD